MINVLFYDQFLFYQYQFILGSFLFGSTVAHLIMGSSKVGGEGRGGEKIYHCGTHMHFQFTEGMGLKNHCYATTSLTIYLPRAKPGSAYT